ncbi:MAG TPA: transposase [Candidatus Angelobacter sp.]|nr:transposase [Candidatus Angelobacter sp.]
MGIPGRHCKKQRIFVDEIRGMEGYVHILIEIPLDTSFSDAMREIKTASAQWMGASFVWDFVSHLRRSKIPTMPTHGSVPQHAKTACWDYAVGYRVVAPLALETEHQ